MKAGQLCTYNRKVYRARRKTCGCEGCAFAKNPFTCPAIVTKANPKPKVDCMMDMIVLVKV